MQRHEIPKLEFRDYVSRMVGPFASIKFGPNNGADGWHQPFVVEIETAASSSRRTMTVEELISFRDWANKALHVALVETEAA